MCSRLAFLLGEGGSAQSMTTPPERMHTTAAPKKLTPKRKLHIGWTHLDLNYRFARWTHLGSIYACVRWNHLYSAYGFGCELILFSIYEFVRQTYVCMFSNYIAHLIVFFSKTDQMHAQYLVQKHVGHLIQISADLSDVWRSQGAKGDPPNVSQ